MQQTNRNLNSSEKLVCKFQRVKSNLAWKKLAAFINSGTSELSTSSAPS